MSPPAGSRPRKSASRPPLRTPDGRYIVVRGRLWRASDPTLSPAARAEATRALGVARQAVRAAAGEPAATRAARASVDAAKRALGERGPPWWRDGARDYTRCLAKNTPYADWYAAAMAGV